MKISGAHLWLGVLLLFAGGVVRPQGAVVARWDFNNLDDGNPETGTLTARLGSATGNPAGNASFQFGSVGRGETSDPLTADNSQLRLGRFPARTAANKSAGIQFMISTVGFERIRLRWDQYNSATASRYWRVQYTISGGREWIDHSLVVNTNAAVWQLRHEANFSGLPGVDDSANFGVRIVSEFASTAASSAAEGYLAVREESTYSTAGTCWLDVVNVTGTVLGQVDTPPTIESLPNLSLPAGTAIEPIPLVVSDAETAQEDLRFSVASSPPGLVASATVSGTGGERTLNLTTLAGRIGNARITVTVEDDAGATASAQFDLEIIGENGAPEIAPLGDQESIQGRPIGPVPVLIADREQALESLRLQATSSNTHLVAPQQIIFSGTGAERALTITPEAGQFGESLITVTVSDGALESSASFWVRVLPEQFAARWNFNSALADDNPETGTLEPEAGQARLSILAASHSFGSVAGGRTSDGAAQDNSMLRLSGFPAQGEGNKSAGIEVRLSTKSWRNLALVFDQYNSTSASRFWRVQYSLDGFNFIDHAVISNSVPGQWRLRRVVSLGPVAGLANNADFALRLVSEWASSAAGGSEEYGAVSEGTAYTGAGTLWMDQLGIAGEMIEDRNTPPELGALADQTFDWWKPFPEIPCAISDAETAAGQLVVNASSSNVELIAAVEVAGAGAERSLLLRRGPARSGESIIHVQVADAEGKMVERSFKVTVTYANTPPFLPALQPLRVARNAVIDPIPFKTLDLEVPAEQLTVRAESSNERLIPGGTISFSGSGPDRLVSLRLAADQTGQALVRIFVSDGELESFTELGLTVLPNDPVAIWNFDSSAPDGRPSSGSRQPVAGTGEFVVAGEALFAFAAGSEAEPSNADDSAVLVSIFPLSTEGNKTSGAEFRASTVGRQNPSLVWDQRNSDTASRYWRIQFTTNGTDFADHLIVTNGTPGLWHPRQIATFEGRAGVNDNARFAVRIVAEFESTATGSGAAAFVAVNGHSSYSPAGTLSLDQVEIHAQPLPYSPPVALSVTRAGGWIQISWPSEAAEYEPETAESLAGPWRQFDPAPPETREPNTLKVLADGPARFFRIKRKAF